MKLLITGGCGFLGSNLAHEAIRRGDETVLFDNLSREGSEDNLNWLQNEGKVTFKRGDIRNEGEIGSLIREYRPEVIFHLAGQVAMTTSIADPLMDFQINALGTLNLLEAIRKHSPESAIIYSSTNKVYGDLEQFSYREAETRYECMEKPSGFDESTPLEFHSPYGCSKGAADQYMLDYARIFGLKAVVFRHSSMYGGRQFATYDQGWIGWFCQQALLSKEGKLKEPFTISGNGKQVRDLLHAEDMKRLYFLAVEKIDRVKGQVFNIGGGMKNSLSLLELFGLLEQILDTNLEYKKLSPRESDQKVFVADIAKAGECLGWKPEVGRENGIRMMLEWCQSFI